MTPEEEAFVKSAGQEGYMEACSVCGGPLMALYEPPPLKIKGNKARHGYRCPQCNINIWEEADSPKPPPPNLNQHFL